MTLQDKARRMLEADEGIKLKPYKCTSGKLTIGIGRNLEDVGLSADEVDLIFENDYARARRGAVKIFGAQFIRFSENRQLALINLVFQLGAFGFEQFKNTIAAIKAENWKAAAMHLLNSKYAQQTPNRAQRVASMLRDDLFPYR